MRFIYILLIFNIVPDFLYSQENFIQIKKDSCEVVYQKVNKQLNLLDSVLSTKNCFQFMIKKLSDMDTIFYYNPLHEKTIDSNFRNFKGKIIEINEEWMNFMRIDSKSLVRKHPLQGEKIRKLNNCIIITNTKSVFGWSTFINDFNYEYCIQNKRTRKFISMNIKFEKLYFDLNIQKKGKRIKLDAYKIQHDYSLSIYKYNFLIHHIVTNSTISINENYWILRMISNRILNIRNVYNNKAKWKNIKSNKMPKEIRKFDIRIFKFV